MTVVLAKSLKSGQVFATDIGKRQLMVIEPKTLVLFGTVLIGIFIRQSWRAGQDL
jgi:hypothetical protein